MKHKFEENISPTWQVYSSRCLLLILFFLSGAAALVYEVVWIRMFGLVFGNTVLAVSTVLSVFMAGLALGSSYMGRVVDRRQDALRLYALLEAGIGLFAILMPWLLSVLNMVYVQLYHLLPYEPYTFGLIRFLLSFLVLLVPTTLMGGTFPVLGRFFVTSRTHLARNVGDLYAVNTFGAVLGTFAAGFFLIEALGVKELVYLTGGVNLLIAIASLGIYYFLERTGTRPVPQMVTPKQAGAPSDQSVVAKLALWGLFLSGFAALSYEVLWSRVLIYLLTTSVHAFSLMLATFLIGLALGSLIFARFVDHLRNLLSWFGGLQVTIGVYGVCSIMLLANAKNINEWAMATFGLDSWWSWNLIRFVVAGLIMLFPTMLMGAAFPLASRIYTKQLARLGRSLGDLYCFDTVGGVLGSFVMGFILLPIFGTQNGILLTAAVNLCLGLFVLSFVGSRFSRWRYPLPALVIAGMIVFRAVLPRGLFLPVFQVTEPSNQIIYYDEGISGTVTVERYASHQRILINGICVAGTDFDLRTTQKLQGHIPLLLHPHPRQVMQVGFGAGETSRVVSLYGVERLDGVEISSEVTRAGRFFTGINANIYATPFFHAVIMDGKNYALVTDKKYDVIMNDSIHPSASGNASLYTLEYFQNCRQRLKEDGIMSSWFPLFGLKPDDFRMIVKTFHEVFPHCTLWIGNNCLNRHALLVGWKKPEEFRIDFHLLEQKLAAAPIHRDLEEIHLDDIYSILDCFMLDEHAIAKFVQGVQTNTDDHPLLEFSAPKVWGADKLVWAQNLENVANLRTSIFPHLYHFTPPAPDSVTVQEKMTKFFAATTYVLRGEIAELRDEHLQARNEYTIAMNINPDDRDAPYLLALSGQYAEALQQKVEKQPNDRESRVNLGFTYLGEGKYDLAVTEFEQVLELDPNNPEFLTNLGMAKLFLKNWSEAIALFKRALKLKPNLIEAHYNLGLAIIQSGQPLTDAIAEWQQVVALNPTYADAYYNLGLANLRLGNIDSAVAALRKTVDLRPYDPEPHKLLAMTYERRGMLSEAVTEYQNYLERLPRAPDAESIRNKLRQLRNF